LKILIYEYVSGGGYIGQDIPRNLLAEGYAMLRSITSDFKAAGHEVTVLLDDRVSKLNPPIAVDFTVPILQAEEPPKFIGDIARINDAVYIVAPETGQILQNLVQVTEAAGRASLNCSSEAIARLSDKTRLYEHLTKIDVPTPTTLTIDFNADIETTTQLINNELTYPVVLKPVDGAGCSGMSIIKKPNELKPAIAKLKENSTNQKFIAQNYINGLAASISVISNGKKAVAISLNEQQVALANPKGESQYIGGCVPLEHPLSAKACSIVERLIESIPGLRGYVGVDVLFSENDVYIVDVNPRLTTSFIGLHAVADFNVAQAIIDSVTSAKLPKKIHNQYVAFFAKVAVTKPTAEVFQKLGKLEYVCSPPFPLAQDDTAYALVTSRGATMQDACLQIEQAKKGVHSII
jgi:predicted ATP-grasp superfamily ATP-dependent carboligase